MKNTEVATV